MLPLLLSRITWLLLASCFFKTLSHVYAFLPTTRTALTAPRAQDDWRQFLFSDGMAGSITDWRDKMFDCQRRVMNSVSAAADAPPKEICILPFPYQEVLLQGETKQLRLYEERFVKLFDECMKEHCGVVAMGLLTSDGGSSSGLIQTVPLCEIEAYNRVDGFGIFVTIRVVARAQVLEITQQEPYLKAVCIEIADKLPPNLELPNLVASNIENFMLLLSSMEHQLEKAKENKKDQGGEQSEEDAEMQRRIQIARLEDRFYDEDSDDDDCDDDDEEEIAKIMDRRTRFRKAYEVALATDTQGYSYSSTPTAGNGQQQPQSADRTAQELTAISWAAFCSELLAEEDAVYRIQALDMENLFDRLKLALQMLRTKKAKLRVRMQRAGLKFGGEEPDDDATKDK